LSQSFGEICVAGGREKIRGCLWNSVVRLREGISSV